MADLEFAGGRRRQDMQQFGECLLAHALKLPLGIRGAAYWEAFRPFPSRDATGRLPRAPVGFLRSRDAPGVVLPIRYGRSCWNAPALARRLLLWLSHARGLRSTYHFRLGKEPWRVGEMSLLA